MIVLIIRTYTYVNQSLNQPFVVINHMYSDYIFGYLKKMGVRYDFSDKSLTNTHRYFKFVFA